MSETLQFTCANGAYVSAKIIGWTVNGITQSSRRLEISVTDRNNNTTNLTYANALENNRDNAVARATREAHNWAFLHGTQVTHIAFV